MAGICREWGGFGLGLSPVWVGGPETLMHTLNAVGADEGIYVMDVGYRPLWLDLVISCD